jgi:hypothetical protein
MPIGSTLDVVIQQDDLVVLGPPSSIDVAVDIGPKGDAGTQIYTGALDPNSLTSQEFQDIYGDVPRIGDLFLRTDPGDNYGSFYQYLNVPGNDQWEVVVDLADVVSLFFDLNPDFILEPKSGGTGINNGESTITIGGNFSVTGEFPLNFDITGSTSLDLPVSGNVAVTEYSLDEFSSTTSSQLAEIISDETGTGLLVFNTSPTILGGIETTDTTINLFNNNATTINFAGDATSLFIGATSGSTTINNDLFVVGQITGNVTGDLAGNADTASALQNSIDLSLIGDVSGSASFDGSGSVVINTVIQPDSVALGTDTTGNYVQSASAGMGIEILGSGESADLTISNTGVLSLSGTTNQISISASTGSVVVSLPSDVTISNTLYAVSAIFSDEVFGISPTSSAAFTTKSYVDNAIGTGNLPSQTGNEGKYLSTSGSSAFWTEIVIPAAQVVEKTSAYTLELSDAQKIIEVNSVSATTITIPADSSVNFPIGSNIDIVQTGAGQITINGEGGVTLLSKDSNTKTDSQYSGVTIYKQSSNTWVLIGDLSS